MDLTSAGTKTNRGQNSRGSAARGYRKAGMEPSSVYLVAGRVLTRVKKTDGSASTCSPRERFL